MEILDRLFKKFGVVSVMNVCIYKLNADASYGRNAIDISNFVHLSQIQDPSKILYLDTLTLSNLKESAPKKTFKAGLNNIPLVRFGKNTTLQLEDALGDLNTLKYFFNLTFDNDLGAIISSEEFARPIALEGEIPIKNINGEEFSLHIFIPCLLPNGELEVISSSDNDMGVFNLSGELFPIKIKVGEKIFHCKYIISTNSLTSNEMEEKEFVPIYSGDTVLLIPAVNNTVPPSLEDVVISAIGSGDTVLLSNA